MLGPVDKLIKEIKTIRGEWFKAWFKLLFLLLLCYLVLYQVNKKDCLNVALNKFNDI